MTSETEQQGGIGYINEGQGFYTTKAIIYVCYSSVNVLKNIIGKEMRIIRFEYD